MFMFAVIVLLSYTTVMALRQNNLLKNALPYVLQGEQINKLELIGTDSNLTEGKPELNSNFPLLLFIFSRPCSPCNENIIYWKKITEILEPLGITSYGILLTDLNSAVNFSTSAELNFKTFVPSDLHDFLKQFRLKLNSAQTIVIQGKKVEYLKIGKLTGDDTIEIISQCKKIQEKISI